MSKKVNYPTEDSEPNEHGSVIHWSRRKGENVPVTCGACGKTRRVWARGDFLEPTYTGLHRRKCFARSSASTCFKGYTIEILFPKGTKVLYHQRQRGNNQKVGIECRGCFKETDKLKYVWNGQIKNYIRWLICAHALVAWWYGGDSTLWRGIYVYLKFMNPWRELCTDCFLKSNPNELKKFTTKRTAPSGTVTHFEDEIDGRVLVAFSDPLSGCGCTRRVRREYAISHWQHLPAVCRFHHCHPDAYHRRRMEIEGNGAGNGNGQKQMSTGRPPALDENQRFLVATDESITELYLEKPGRHISSPMVVARLVSKGIHTTDNSFRVKLRRLTGMLYDEYVALVVSKIGVNQKPK